MRQTSSFHSQIGSQLLGKKKKNPQILYQMLSLFPLEWRQQIEELPNLWS